MPTDSQVRMKARTTTTQDPDPNPTRSRATISSLLTTSESQTLSLLPKKKKKNNFTSSTFRGLGCTASAHVSVPGAIRAAADWDHAKNKMKKKKKKGKLSGTNPTVEVCCGPGMGLSTDAASVDCVVRRDRGRLKIDGETSAQRERDRDRDRERPSFSTRRMVNPEPLSYMDSEHSPMGGGIPSGFDIYGGSRYHRHARHPSPEGFAEIMMLHSNLMMGGRSERIDRYREWRLDVDHMSYEELLELGDKIGHVNTGLKEDEIVHCLSKTKPLDNWFSKFNSETEAKCSICQEDYEEEDEIGKLDCGHFYHIDCVKQWLAQRNMCPICKTAAAPHRDC